MPRAARPRGCHDRGCAGHEGVLTDPRARQDAYRVLFDAQFRPILGYALRRTACAADAADVAAETLLIAWRRFDEVPAGHEARLWL